MRRRDERMRRVVGHASWRATVVQSYDVVRCADGGCTARNDAMALIVQKYGGTSVADPDRMRAVADNVAFTRRHGNDVVVVVSAMGKSTDNLIALADASVRRPVPGREMDMLLTTGERVTAALLTMALARPRRRRRQLHRQPGRHHHRHRATARRRSSRSRATACARRSPPARSPSSPGSRGSSTDEGDHDDGPRCVATSRRRRWPARFDADACEIYTDVTGVFSADPRIVPQARKLSRVSFDEMLEMAGSGLQGAGAALGRVRPQPRRRICTCARASRGSQARGSSTTDEKEQEAMEDPIISGVVTDVSESKVTVLGRARPAGDLGGAVRAARRRQRQRRHDRAEHVDRGHDRHQLHDAVGRHGRRRGDRAARSPTRSAPAASPTTRTSPRCRSSAPA